MMERCFKLFLFLRNFMEMVGKYTKVSCICYCWHGALEPSDVRCRFPERVGGFEGDILDDEPMKTNPLGSWK